LDKRKILGDGPQDDDSDELSEVKVDKPINERNFK
jgi:hypothetical protein